MTYIVENNYILENHWRSLVSFLVSPNKELFLLNPYVDESIVVKDKPETGDQDDEDEELTLYWSPANGDLSKESLDNRELKWRDLYSEIDLASFEDQLPNYPLIRLILWHCSDADKNAFIEAITKLLPPFEPLYMKYEMDLNEIGIRTLLWSQYWIGGVDSEENEIYMTIYPDDSIKLEYVDNFTADPENIEEYILESTIRSQLEISKVDHIKGKSEFLEGFRSLFTNNPTSYLANVLDVRELEFNYDDLATKINSVSKIFTVLPNEIENLIVDLKKEIC